MNRIRKVLMIFSKEMAGYFNSSIAYIFLIIFTLLNGGLFMTQFFVIGRADMRSFFYGLPMLLCIFLPAVSMRLWAEEKRGNTQELLLTFPMAPHELVLGKFLASFCFYLLALACTAPVPLMLMVLGQPDLGPILGGYIGGGVGIFLFGDRNSCFRILPGPDRRFYSQYDDLFRVLSHRDGFCGGFD
mgnify:CR=1 FL=1